MIKYLVLILVGLLFIYLRLHFIGFGIYGDGNGYYAISHTILFEKNLDFNPIIKYLSNFQGKKHKVNRIIWNTNLTRTGKKNIPWLIGTSLFWLPSMIVIYVINLAFNLKLSNFSLIYEIGPMFSGLILGVSGLFFLEKYLRYFFNRKVVFLTLTATTFATIVSYFILLEPALSHPPSFFIVCYLLYRTYKRDLKQTDILWIGLLTGLLFITRAFDVIFLIPVFYQIYCFNKKNLKFKFLFLFLFGFFIGNLPQLIFQKLIYGSFFSNPYFIGQKGNFSNFSFLSLYNNLFSSKRGFFLWSPVLLIGLIGLISQIRQKKYSYQSTVILATFIISVILVVSWLAIVPAGFGNRFLLNAIPYFSFGLAYIFSKINFRISLTIVIAFSLWNFLLLTQFFFDGDRLVKDKNNNINTFIKGQIETPIKIIYLLKEKGYNETIKDNIIN